MTVDREQIRRDARMILDRDLSDPLWPNLTEGEWAADAGMLARHCRALLAELEQAEARLVKAHTLAEALREMLDRMETCDEPGCEAEQHITYEIRDALAAWDADQPGPDPTP